MATLRNTCSSYPAAQFLLQLAALLSSMPSIIPSLRVDDSPYTLCINPDVQSNSSKDPLGELDITLANDATVVLGYSSGKERFAMPQPGPPQL